jgi:hypothetical protein
MEDLPREITSQLKPYARTTSQGRDPGRNVVWIDGMGRVRPAGWITSMAWTALAVSVISTSLAAGLGWLYATDITLKQNLVEKLEAADKRILQLVAEKEILMANLVLAGVKPDTPPQTLAQVPDVQPVTSQVDARETLALPLDPTLSEEGKEPPGPALVGIEGTRVAGIDSDQDPKAGKDTVSVDASRGISSGEVAIENLNIIKSTDRKEIRIAFSLKKSAGRRGSISGRVFAILKTDEPGESNWLVLPQGTLDKGMPAEIEKGQFFSIVSYKTMSFKAVNVKDPERFTSLAIVIYNDRNRALMAHEVVPFAERN